MNKLILATLATAFTANLAIAQPLVQVPDKLNPGANESLAMITLAKGVQIYE